MKIKTDIIFIALIVLCTFCAYAPSLTNSFVWDDYYVVVDNTFVKSWNNFPALFSKNYLSPFVKHGDLSTVDYTVGSGETSYRPLATLSYFFDYTFWKLNPFGYHLTNLCLHILNSLLLYSVTFLLIRNKPAALAAALLFSLHPINSEAVNVISFREDLLVFLFYMASFALYITLDSVRASKRIVRYIFSCFLFFLALFSKEMAITFPAALILYDYFFTDRAFKAFFTKRRLFRYGGYVLVALFYLWVRFAVFVNTTEVPGVYPGGSFYSNFLTMSRVVSVYLQWIFLPIDIPAFLPSQPYLFSKSLLDPGVMMSIALILLCAILALKIRRISKKISFAILWFFVTLAPAMNILPLMNHIASRYVYLPLAGFCFLSAETIARVSSIKISPAILSFLIKISRAFLIALLLIYGLVTFMKTFSWKDNAVLFLEMTQRFPSNAAAHATFGDCFARAHLFENSIAEYRTALALNPRLVEAYNNLGIAYGEVKQYEKSVDCFQRAIEIDPLYADAYSNLGITYARMHEEKKALASWTQVLRINPRHRGAKENLKIFYRHKSRHSRQRFEAKYLTNFH